mmetsp:Transcript_26180/g.51401  ORF Transcript_26180/g.51401 Transcript_26180/m.51401 type:complete len:378 (+) Transcript_26180:572-1705(+)
MLRSCRTFGAAWGSACKQKALSLNAQHFVQVLSKQEGGEAKHLFLAKRNFFLESAKIIIPHPAKVKKGGEDAAFCGTKYLAVADGVGGWDTAGVDAGLYSREILERVQQALREHATRSRFTPSPLEILKQAYNKTQAIGSSTVCLVFLDEYARTARCANLGDSGFILYRSKDDEVVARSEPQCHDFNFPLQLGTGSSDLPEHADAYEVPVKCGDFLLLATDGVWDNLYEEDCCAVLRQAQSVQEAAENVARMAFEMSLDPKRKSPFAEKERASSTGGRQLAASSSSTPGSSHMGGGTGGKPDDIAVVVAKVRDPWQMPRSSVPPSVAKALGLDGEREAVEAIRLQRQEERRERRRRKKKEGSVNAGEEEKEKDAENI